ncbi:LruC domain-containing protein [Plesiomonas shigelloides]|uniref:LruC domain-containing protein n=1 Tax=Plesiomonas shigelloides TaxID=703 RepID=UPI001C5BB9BC|nr:LruC domain-containing protein [Plesiomonas shigelloides]MBW3793261.1 LruC domain-containing protein [Plesiomonas shigelloides]
MRSLSTLISLSSLMLAVSASAVDFSWMTGSPTVGYTPKGRPTATISVPPAPGTLQNFYSMLPEGIYVKPEYISSADYTKIELDPDFTGTATVKLRFLNEGAGYRNSLGYFIYDANNPPKTAADIANHVIVFPNTSLPPDGEMVSGDTVDLEGVALTANQGIGLFVVPNGWGWSGSFGNVSNKAQYKGPFYNLAHLNTEPAPSLKFHNVVLFNQPGKSLIVGFEDIFRTGGDHDFNDVIAELILTPVEAIKGISNEGSSENPIYSVDSTRFNQVVQNNNPNIEFNSYYPGQNKWASVAFEDLWPQQGDYDFNDVVISYKLHELSNNVNALKKLTIDAKIQALGAGYHNGFAWRIPGIQANEVKSAVLTKNGEVVNNLALDPSHNEAVFVISYDLKSAVPTQCEFFRTKPNCRENINTEYKLVVEFQNPIVRSRLVSAPFDPFIFATPGIYHGENIGFQPGMKWQVHLPQFAGTEVFDTTLYGRLDDNSALFSTSKFIDSRGFPWAMNFIDGWSQSAERIDITQSYPAFPSWIQSSGLKDTDWYHLLRAIVDRLYQGQEQ